MANEFNFDLPITCPNCKREFKKPLAELETNQSFPCPGCGATFSPDGDSFKPIRQAIDKLKKQIAKLGGTINAKV